MYRLLFQSCLSQHVQRYVGQEPVQINWSRNAVRCSCRDCINLNNFLRSPVDQVGRFKVEKSRRHHLHVQLDAYTDCKHETERIGYPETLVVTKQGTSFAEKLEGWKRRSAIAIKELHALDGPEVSADSETYLKKLLAERYDEIMTLRKVRVMTATQQQSSRPPPAAGPSSLQGAASAAVARAAAQGARPQNPPQVAGQKRKAVVIDLTDD